MICKTEVTEYYETSERQRERERKRDRDRDRERERERVREIVRYSNHTRSFRHRQLTQNCPSTLELITI